MFKVDFTNLKQMTTKLIQFEMIKRIKMRENVKNSEHAGLLTSVAR